jgi:hypothetical protein
MERPSETNDVDRERGSLGVGSHRMPRSYRILTAIRSRHCLQGLSDSGEQSEDCHCNQQLTVPQ